MRILVSGGAGFIGSHLVERLLKDGHDVFVVDKSSTNIRRNLPQAERLTVICNDINRINDLRDVRNIDQVVHLAAMADIVPSIENPTEYHYANVDGTVQVLEFARKQDVKRFVYAASASCYGDRPKVPTVEADPIDCKYPYALTKYVGEQYALHWGKLYALPVVSLRFFNVFGPRSRTTGAYGAVFGVFLAQKLKNKPFTVVGDGSQSRDFVFVTDVVNAICLALQSRKSGEVYNIGSGQHTSINSLVNHLKGTCGIEHVPKRPGEPQITCAQITKANRDLGYLPQIDFKHGVEMMLENIEYWREAPLWNRELIADATAKWFQHMGDKNAH